MKPVPSRETIRRQKLASNPAHSAFVQANAGSGKTHVLVERVVRLLLQGVPPDRILCLTFTRAAAAQMQVKVAQLLGSWATLPDDRLRVAIAEMNGGTLPHPPGTLQDWAMLADARRLFARALETPGGLKIQTIHAFCERLLHQFPFEANVPAGFEVMEERETAALQEAAKRALYAEIAGTPRGPMGTALATLGALGCDARLPDALDAAFSRRSDFEAMLRDDTVGSIDGAVRALARALGIEPGTTVDAVTAEFLAGGLLAGDWEGLAQALETGSKADKDHAARLRAAAALGDPEERLSNYLDMFLTGGGDPRVDPIGTKKFRKEFPAFVPRLDAEHQRVPALLDRRRAAAILQRTAAFYRLADRVLQTYSDAKARRGALDFGDLISRTRQLLTRVEAGWVLFKLDGGIDHLLIDEAQDTSPEAWAIVRALAEEFTAGAGAREGAHRTLFAVGDEKQSIYGFQGAVPEEFGAMRALFERKHEGAKLGFERVMLTQSFRSAMIVLEGVDHVFRAPEAHKGLESGDPRPTVHESARPGAPGMVEIWPLMEPLPEELEEKPAWDAPFDRERQTSPVVRLAKRIAESVKDWIAEGVPAGEILILVRQRAAMFQALLRELKVRRLPVAGADRLVVTDHIAVKDLMALGDALTTPDDDLSLAAALKSPLFGLDDDDLMQLAPSRKGRLRDALIGGAVTDLQREAARKLAAWEAEAKSLAPFEFYAGVLGRDRARSAFRRRFGVEADDALDAFLSAAEDFGALHPPTLPGFLAFMRASPIELKRDLDIGGGEIRIMTVHGAKGLEASTLVVAESCTPPKKAPGPMLMPLSRAAAPPGAAPLPVWATRTAEDPAPVRAARDAWYEKEENEHRRLLYVALTRAKDRLVVAGHKSKNKIPGGCWYERVRDGLAEVAEKIAVDWAKEPILRLSDGVLMAEATGGRAADVAHVPDWLRAPPPAEPSLARSVSPSTIGAATKTFSRTGIGALHARLRGTLLHRLLENLPAVEPGRRRALAEMMAARETELPEAMRAEIVASSLALLDDPRFASVFRAEARAEIPIVGRLPGRDGEPGAILSGRIDRLAVDATSVTVVDYKTDAVPPADGAPTPDGYLAQLAAYRTVLRKLYPGRKIRCAILWTAVPRLDEINSFALDRAESVATDG